MTTYRVEVIQTITEYTWVTVEAPNEDAAAELAVEASLQVMDWDYGETLDRQAAVIKQEQPAI